MKLLQKVRRLKIVDEQTLVDREAAIKQREDAVATQLENWESFKAEMQKKADDLNEREKALSEREAECVRIEHEDVPPVGEHDHHFISGETPGGKKLRICDVPGCGYTEGL